MTDVKNILFAVSGVYDETLGSWRQDMSALFPEEQSETRIFPIRAANSTGFGKTRDSILRDFQNRDFAFCLRHPPEVICGKTPHIAGPDYKRTDLMPYALTIIKSIRFVADQGDDAEGVPASATEGSVPVKAESGSMGSASFLGIGENSLNALFCAVIYTLLNVSDAIHA